MTKIWVNFVVTAVVSERLFSEGLVPITVNYD